GGVGRGARVRLDVREARAEEFLESVDRDLLDLVDELASAVVALAGVTLGVLVGEDAALGLERGDGSEVLRRDHLEGRLLPVELGIEQCSDLRIEIDKAVVKTHGAIVSPVNAT